MVASEDHAGLVCGQCQRHDSLTLQHLRSLVNEDVSEVPLQLHGGKVQRHLHRGHHHTMLAHHVIRGNLKGGAIWREAAVFADTLWNRVYVAILRQNTQQQGLAVGALAKVCIQVFRHVKVRTTARKRQSEWSDLYHILMLKCCLCPQKS